MKMKAIKILKSIAERLILIITFALSNLFIWVMILGLIFKDYVQAVIGLIALICWFDAFLDALKRYFKRYFKTNKEE